MFDLRQALTRKASAVIPATAYSQFRSDGAISGAPPPAEETVYYEIALPAEAPWPALAERRLPSFARFLQSRSIPPNRPQGTMVAIFLKEHCFVLRGEDLVDLFCELEGLTQDAYQFRVLKWLADTR